MNIQQAIYVDAPESLLYDSLDEDRCQYACSSFKAFCYTGRVLGKRPVSRSLRLIKDGLAIQSPHLPDFWQDGWLAVLSIADCKVDADGWQVVQDETFQDLMADLEAEFAELLARSILVSEV